MIDSSVVAGWIAHVAFVVLLVFAFRELGPKKALAFAALWLAGYLGLPRLATNGATLITSFVAVLDIVLVLLIFKGDVRIT